MSDKSSSSSMTPAQTHMEAQLRAFYAKHNPGNNQNMCVFVSLRMFVLRESDLSSRKS